MSTTMLSSASSLRSTLNPNAPLFVPSAFKQVEDFSPKWWELVQTTAWYRDYWFNEHQQYESLYKDEEGDIESLLPDSIDLDLEHDMSLFEAEAEMQLANRGFENEREVIMRNLNQNSPRNGGFNHFNEQSKYKPMHYVNPKCNPRYSIHQPR